MEDRKKNKPSIVLALPSSAILQLLSSSPRQSNIQESCKVQHQIGKLLQDALYTAKLNSASAKLQH